MEKLPHHFTIEQKEEFDKLDDDRNPEFTFGRTHSSILALIATGQIDAKAMAWKALADMGMNEKGEWIGFRAAGRRFEANVVQNIKI